MLRHGVVVGELLLVTPLVGVDVMPTGRVLNARRGKPVLRHRDGRPRLHRSQFLLPHIVRQSASVDSHAAAEHQRVDTGPVDQVRVVPVVDSRTDKNRAFAAGMLGGGSPFTREANQVAPADSGVLLAPGGRERGGFVVVVGRVIAAESAIDPVLSHQQVVNGGHLHGASVGRRQRANRDAAMRRATGSESRPVRRRRHRRALPGS